MNDVVIKPCPICGGDAVINPANFFKARVSCTNTKEHTLDVYRESLGIAIQDWNNMAL